MSDNAIKHTSDTTLDSNFANPNLAEIAKLSEIKSVKSVWKSGLYEVGSWLIIPLGIISYLYLLSYLLVIEDLTFSYLKAAVRYERTHPPYYSPTEYYLELYRNYSSVIHIVLQLVITVICYIFFVKIFFQVRRWAKRYRINALSRLSKDARNPILYLRSFGHENAQNFQRRSLKTYEEDLVFALRGVGPVVAVGKPGEEISPLGATRIYLKDKGDEWKENVRRLMANSQLIVIQPGTSEGVLWEMEVVLNEVDPTKLLISFLPWRDFDRHDRESEYQQFKREFRKTLKESNSRTHFPFPETIGDANFITFTKDWQPKLAELSGWQKLLYKFSITTLTNEALRPILSKRGLKLKKWKTVVYLIYLLWLAQGFILVGGYILLLIVGLFFIWLAPENVDMSANAADVPGSPVSVPVTPGDALVNPVDSSFTTQIINGLMFFLGYSGGLAFVIVACSFLINLPNLFNSLAMKIFSLFPKRKSGMQESIGLLEENK